MDHGYSTRHTHLAYLDTQSSLPAVAELALLVAVTWTKWTERRQMRKALRRMPNERLQDIGVSRAAAEAEADKPFWKE